MTGGELKARSIAEVYDIIASDTYRNWAQTYMVLWHERARLRQHADDPVMQSVLRAGEYDNRAATAQAEFLEFEDSFEPLSDYEDQRRICTEAWTTLEGSEVQVEMYRQRTSEWIAKRDAAFGIDGSDTTDVAVINDRLRANEEKAAHCAKETEILRQRLAILTKQRDQLWTAVQASWALALRAGLATAEYQYHAQRVRHEIEILQSSDEGLINKAKMSPDAINQKRDSLRAKKSQLVREAENNFGCLLIETFLYWPHRDELKSALCVPLLDEHKEFNIQLSAGKIYRVARDKGVAFIEPIAVHHESTTDPRLEAFFA